jgi:hypothetical protein
LNTTLSDFVLDCSDRLGPANKLHQIGASADRLAIYYKDIDGEWNQLYDNDGLRALLQTPKVDQEQVLSFKLEASKKGRFSTYTDPEEVLTRFDIYRPVEELDCFYPGTIDIPEKDPHIERCVENIKDKLRGFRNILANEASSREFISPVLLAAVLLIPATKLGVEMSVVGDFDHGRVDYSVTKGTELICISEAKAKSLNEGLAMNLMQCQGAIHQNKRKRKRADGFDYIYGVITTAEKWRYIILTNENQVYKTRYDDFIPLDMSVIKEDSGLRTVVKKVVTTIAWMLQDRTQNDEPSAKRQRVNKITQKD